MYNFTNAKEIENHLHSFAGNLTAKVKSPLLSINRGAHTTGTRIISGLIKNADSGRPVHRAHVKIKGKTAEAISDALGRFSIEVDQKDEVLLIEAFPYHTVEMALTPLSEMTVLLRLSDSVQYGRYGPNGIFVGATTLSSSFGEIIMLGNKVAILNSPEPLPDSVMYIIDGKRVDKKFIQALNPEEIDKVMIYKNYEAEQKYGKGAGPGVVDIYMKK
jgi:hypothetical protein